MEINISDYVTEDQIKEAIIDETRSIVRQGLFVEKDNTARVKNYERVMYNAVNRYVSEECDGIMGIDHKKKIAELVADTLKNKRLDFNIFRKKDAWNSEESLGYTYLQEAIKANRDIIENKVKEMMESVDENYLRAGIEDMIMDIINKRLSDK